MALSPGWAAFLQSPSSFPSSCAVDSSAWPLTYTPVSILSMFPVNLMTPNGLAQMPEMGPFPGTPACGENPADPRKGGCCWWTVGHMGGQELGVLYAESFLVSLKPSMTLVPDAQVHGPPDTPFPQEAAQDSLCPFLCCPPEGLGKGQCTPALPHCPFRPWG